MSERKGPCPYTASGACVWPDGEPEPYCSDCDHAADHTEWLAEVEEAR